MKYITLSIIGLTLVYLLFFPVKINPAAWQPPENIGFEGQFAQNDRLKNTNIHFEESCKECESVYVDSLNRIYGASVTGEIWRYENAQDAGKIIANTGGRPLGLQKNQVGDLVVADSQKGLLSVDPQGGISTLSTTADGLKLGFTDDLEIADDGIVYFSDASWKFAIGGYKLDLLEHRPNGRLLSYDPTTQTTSVLLDSLYFANGIAVSHEQNFVLVNETGKYRITRYWLKGTKAGTSDVLIDNLPGFPDGISQGSNGIFWIALISPRDKTLDNLLPTPFLRKIVARLPEFMKPKPQNYACVLGIDRNGTIIHNLQDPDGKFAQISSVTERNGKLYFGSLGNDGIGVLEFNSN